MTLISSLHYWVILSTQKHHQLLRQSVDLYHEDFMNWFTLRFKFRIYELHVVLNNENATATLHYINIPSPPQNLTLIYLHDTPHLSAGYYSWTAWPWRCRQCNLLEGLELFTHWYSIPILQDPEQILHIILWRKRSKQIENVVKSELLFKGMLILWLEIDSKYCCYMRKTTVK
jgi:hypothetical protein